MVKTNPEEAAQVLFDNLKERQLDLVRTVLRSRADTREMVGELARLEALAHFDVVRPEAPSSSVSAMDDPDSPTFWHHKPASAAS